MPGARIKRCMGDCLFFLDEREFFENFDGGLDTLSAPLNMQLSKELIRYSCESKDTALL